MNLSILVLHISGITVFAPFFLAYFSSVFSRSIHVSWILNVSKFPPFSWLKVFHCIFHIWFIHSSVHCDVGCFHLLAIVNNAVMNNHLFWVLAFNYFGHISRGRISQSYSNSLFNILRHHQIVFQRLHYFTVQQAMHEDCDLSTSSPTLVSFWSIFYFSFL